MAGLGNGSLIKFKRKKLQLCEVYSEIHTNQICGMILDQERNILITASNDLSIGFHSVSKEKVIDKTVLKLGVNENIKLNDL